MHIYISGFEPKNEIKSMKFWAALCNSLSSNSARASRVSCTLATLLGYSKIGGLQLFCKFVDMSMES